MYYEHRYGPENRSRKPLVNNTIILLSDFHHLYLTFRSHGKKVRSLGPLENTGLTM